MPPQERKVSLVLIAQAKRLPMHLFYLGRRGRRLSSSSFKKRERSESVSPSVGSTLCDPMDCSPPGSSVHGLSRQEKWSGVPFPSPGDLSNPGIKLRSPELQADSLPS